MPNSQEPQDRAMTRAASWPSARRWFQRGGTRRSALRPRLLNAVRGSTGFRLALAVAISGLILILPAAASARPAAGGWSGDAPQLTFEVSAAGDKMTKFTVPAYPVYCFNILGGPGSGEVTTRTFYVPSIDIAADGKFDAVYHPTNSNGDADGELEVSGQFQSNNQVSGKLNYNRGQCFGGADFSATHSGAGGPSGGTTAKPKPVAFQSHCTRKHGKRVCLAPRPRKNHVYRGKTSGQQAVTLTVDKRGRYVGFAMKGLLYHCADGTDGSEDAVRITLSDHQQISKTGTFTHNVVYDPGGGYTHEIVYVVGAFDGRKARGKIVGNTQIAGHGQCTTGELTWSATG
jgi:hypothetical protein